MVTANGIVILVRLPRCGCHARLVISASGVRIGWADLPRRVRGAVEEILGASVVEAVSQPGGFSPGTADRVRTADGVRAFVKAVSPEQNGDSPNLHRREGAVTAALPASVPAPRLLGRYDDGHWVALVLQDVEGRHPVLPWRGDELAAVLAALGDVADAATPVPVPGLPTAREALTDDFAGWRRVRQDPPVGLDPWVAERLDWLCHRADRGLHALSGQTLVHLDVRADNLLVGPQGQVTLVDWPWACSGPAWLDRLMVLVNVRLFGGHDTQAMLSDLAVRTRAGPEDLTAVLAGVAGYFVDVARRPAPAGLPTVRAFQRAQGEAIVTWLREIDASTIGR